MKDLAPFIFPEITDDDIAWSRQVMGLPNDAFDQARKKVLKDQTSIDVAACPGSGKTTLLVAKLAILVRKWAYVRRGICVLSHTNVARNEIEQRLGSTAEGHALLSYPHYVGTIHGFVDRFLGIPWIKACGFPVSMIDTEVALAQRWNVLPSNTRNHLEYRRNGPGLLKIIDTNFSFGAMNRIGEKVHRHMVNACRKTAKAGYFCYEDPFWWGSELTMIAPETIDTLRARFPVVFIDEAQDNSELQSSILHRVFVDGESAVVCQRFGDDNQAIFNSVNSNDEPKTWSFPNKDIMHDIPDSHRFGQTIANFAAPLAVRPQELNGRGPDQRKVSADVDSKHVIFLFESDARSHVLPAFSDYLRVIFLPEALESGSFVAIGGKHKKPDSDNNKPNSVCDYWQCYRPEQAKVDPRPDTFVGYVQAGRTKLEKEGNGSLYPMIESIAAGVLEVVRRAGGSVVRRQRKDRHVRDTLAESKDMLASYNEFLRRFAVDGEELTKDKWDNEWERKVGDFAKAVFVGDTVFQKPGEFLEWPAVGENISADAKAGTIYQKDEQLPKIRLGSIHSVKGETHTGVLVLETYWYEHYLKQLKSWLLKKKKGVDREGARDRSRLKLHYVAMTRSTHLLCLALPSETFSSEERATLIGYGWRIARLDADGRVMWDDPPG